MKLNYVIATGAAALLVLAGSTSAFADQIGVKADGNFGIHLGQFFNLGEKQYAGANSSTTFEKYKDQFENASSTFRNKLASDLSHITAGVVTSVDGSTFVIDPFGKQPTTTVTTMGTTVYKADGSATSSSAITVGSRVVVVGTTTATSSTGDSFTASVVAIIGNCLGHIRSWMGIR